MDMVSTVNCWILVIGFILGIGSIVMRAKADDKK